jgi:hypothetical protein
VAIVAVVACEFSKSFDAEDDDFVSHVFTLCGVLFVMSPIIHTYRHLSIGVCSYSRIILEINIST